MNGETQPVYGPPTLQEAFSQYLLLETARAKNLEIPQQYYGVFVPKRVNEIATNRANVELIPDSQSEGGISFMVVERNLEKPLTKREDWNAWQADIEKTRRENEGELFIVLPSAPPTVNRLQARFSDKINKGELTLNDRILMELKMKVLEGNPSALYVGDYDGEENQGIGRDFYLNTLPAVAKQLGFRFITGANNGKNISFFLQTLGRFTYNDIKPEFRNALFPNANPQSSDIDLWTVQFVNQEDIAEYVIPRESL